VQDLERVRYVTTRYEQMQGLRRVPLGLFLLATAGFQWTVLAVTPTGGIDDRYGKLAVGLIVNVLYFSCLLLAAIALVLYYVIGEHYERKFGRVERRPVGWRRMAVGIGTIFMVVVAVFVVELWLEPPVRLDLLVMGGVLLFFRRKSWRFAAHYLVMGVLIACCGLLPLFGIVSADPREELYLTPLLLGMYLLVGGIFDHLLLVRTMKSLPEENDEAV
jgi:MFS family permease